MNRLTKMEERIHQKEEPKRAFYSRRCCIESIDFFIQIIYISESLTGLRVNCDRMYGSIQRFEFVGFFHGYLYSDSFSEHEFRCLSLDRFKAPQVSNDRVAFAFEKLSSNADKGSKIATVPEMHHH